MGTCLLDQILLGLLSVVFLATTYSHGHYQTGTSFVDASKLKPSFTLIAPYSLRQLSNSKGDGNKFQQNVLLINNIQDVKTNALIREQFNRLVLQVRDANEPITGHLFYEKEFDYFPSDEFDQQQMLLPIELNEINHKNNRNDHSALTFPKKVVISLRPAAPLGHGFAGNNVEFVTSSPIKIHHISSENGLQNFATVQTDKPIYKPGDRVKIRAMVVNENLRVVTDEEIRLQVKNPQNIIVEEVKYSHGKLINNAISDENYSPESSKNSTYFIDHEFEFPPGPLLGNWNVLVIPSDPLANATTNFEVKEYVLPTFDVDIRLPKFVSTEADFINFTVASKYHYGKPVKGRVHCKYGYKLNNDERPIYVGRSMSKTIDNDGEQVFRISLERIWSKFENSIVAPSTRLIVEAIVTENSTGHHEVAFNGDCVFLDTPYKISFDDSIRDFKPAMAQQLSVQVLEKVTNKPAPPGTILTATYKLNGNDTFLAAEAALATGSPVDFKQILDGQAVTDQNGRAYFNLGPFRDDILSMDVKIKWTNSSRSLDGNSIETELAVGVHRLVSHQSSFGWLSIMNKRATNLKVGDLFESDIIMGLSTLKISYMIVARGQIIDLKTLSSDNNMIRFRLTEDMGPIMRLVVFAATPGFGSPLVSDSMRINVDLTSECNLSIDYRSNTQADTDQQSYRPGDEGTLNVNARAGDVISLIGVDKALYGLNNRSHFSGSQLMNQIKGLDTGCGFGGGRNSLDVFNTAGLLVFNENSHPAQSEDQYPRLCGFEDLPGERLPKVRHRRHSMAHSYEVPFNSEDLINRYKSEPERACCWLGIQKDVANHRDCRSRADIVSSFMRQSLRNCSAIFNDCCHRSSPSEVRAASIGLSYSAPGSFLLDSKVISESRLAHDPIEPPHAGDFHDFETRTMIRSDFRETWLFDTLTIDDHQTRGSLKVKLPQSITKLTVSAVALNKDRPMCVLPRPMNLVTFKEFFLKVSVPYKVIVNEKINLIATIFNYSPDPLKIYVYIKGPDSLCYEAEYQGDASYKEITLVPGHSSHSVVFAMIPMRVGEIPLEVYAYPHGSRSQGDIVKQTLRVMPKGRPKVVETTFRLDPSNRTRRFKRSIQTENLYDEIDPFKGLQRSTVRLIPSHHPEIIVPQTQECVVSAVGDKLGHGIQSTIEDVENLIRPTALGESVLTRLGPTIYTARYLASVNKFYGETRWRALRLIQKGYKRILDYRTESGGFSSFKTEPSVYLTAWVAKMLCQLEETPAIASEVHVDGKIIDEAIEWLMADIDEKRQQTWTESGAISQRHRQAPDTLTAFVAIALDKCANHTIIGADEISQKTSTKLVKVGARFGREIENAKRALVKELDRMDKEKNTYALALSAYALSLSSSLRGESQRAIIKLMSMSEYSYARNHLYWRGKEPVETAAYALMALIELSLSNEHQGQDYFSRETRLSPATALLAISNRLSTRSSLASNGDDDFHGAVVALEALSRLAQVQSIRPNDGSSSSTSSSSSSLSPNLGTALDEETKLSCRLNVSNRTKLLIEFDADNAQISRHFKFNSTELSTIDGEVIDIMTQGNGLGTMSLRYKYNVLDGDESCFFSIDATVEEWKDKTTSSAQCRPTARRDPKDIDDSDEPKEVKEDDPRRSLYVQQFDQRLLRKLNLAKEASDNDDSTGESSSGKRNRLRRAIVPKVKQMFENMTSSSLDQSLDRMLSRMSNWLGSKSNNQTTRVSSDEPRSLASSSSSHQEQTKWTTRRSSNPRATDCADEESMEDKRYNQLNERIDYNSHLELRGRRGTKQRSSQPILLLKICVSHIYSKQDSEMAVITVGMLTGFRANKYDLDEILKQPQSPIRMIEKSADESQLFFFLDHIPASGAYCFMFRLISESRISGVHSSFITAYEYYAPTRSCTQYYSSSFVSSQLDKFCDSAEEVCRCAQRSMCPATKRIADLETRYKHQPNDPSNLIDFKRLICSNEFQFVSLVKLYASKEANDKQSRSLLVCPTYDIKGNLTKVQKGDDEQTLGGDSEYRGDCSINPVSLGLENECLRDSLSQLRDDSTEQVAREKPRMLLFGRFDKLERINDPVRSKRLPPKGPRPTGNILRGSSRLVNVDENLLADLPIYRTSYMTKLALDKDSLVFKLVQNSGGINNLIERIQREMEGDNKWNCEKQQY